MAVGSRRKRTKPINWREHPKRWVNGSIDSNGAIHAVALEEIEAHEGATLRGKRWRWNIARQDFSLIAPRTVEEANKRRHLLVLSDEEYFSVCNWLVQHGYAGEEIIPPATKD